MIIEEKDTLSSISTIFTSSGLNLYISKTEQYCSNLFTCSKSISNQKNKQLISEEDVQKAYESINITSKNRMNIKQVFLGFGSFFLSQSIGNITGEAYRFWTIVMVVSLAMISISIFLRKF